MMTDLPLIPMLGTFGAISLLLHCTQLVPKLKRRLDSALDNVISLTSLRHTAKI